MFLNQNTRYKWLLLLVYILNYEMLRYENHSKHELGDSLHL